jgi:hypothetical protein
LFGCGDDEKNVLTNIKRRATFKETKQRGFPMKEQVERYQVAALGHPSNKIHIFEESDGKLERPLCGTKTKTWGNHPYGDTTISLFSLALNAHDGYCKKCLKKLKETH